MFGANAYANFDDFVDAVAVVTVGQRLPGQGAFLQLYPCRDGWLMISIDREVDQRLLEIGTPITSSDTRC